MVLIISGLGIGGAERQILQYVRHRPADLELSLLYLREQESGPDLRSAYLALGIVPRLVNRLAYSWPRFFWHLVRAIRESRPEVLCTVLAGSAGTWGRLAAWVAGVRAITHSDRALNPPVGRVHGLLRPLLDRLTDRFLPNARASGEWLASRGIQPARIRVIPNGVDLSQFDPAQTPSPRPGWGIAEGETVLGFLGKFRPEKRVDLLLESLLLLPPAQRPDWVVLGGDGDLLPVIKARVAADPWLAAHVRFLGLVQDVPGMLAGLDYLVLCSDWEGTPNVVLEAMAMGKPIVATRVSDLPDLLREIGFLAEPGQPQSLAGAIAAMQALPRERRRAMGGQARRRAVEQFAIEAAAQRFWQAHAEVIR